MKKSKTASKPENPSAFKHWISPELVLKIGQNIQSVYPKFDLKSFVKIGTKLQPLELKPRVLVIRDALKAHLPEDYLKALPIILKSLKSGKLKGFDLWPYTEFVQTYGIDHFEESMQALYKLTQIFTAEFAVRPFLVKYSSEAFDLLLKWSQDQNTHVRRWTSEGTRPRLPWGMKLHNSIHDPSKGLQILENLKFDDELYVRKSVANHLNDIAKDHPDLVIKTLQNWQKNCKEKDQAKLDFITKQALRSLIKAGYKPALSLMGYGEKAQIKMGKFKLNKDRFKMNEVLTFEVELISTAQKAQKIAIDYIIHYQKANQKTSPKVFKCKVLNLNPNESINLKKNHALKAVTTRRHYSGLHKIEIQINGHILATADWHLKV